MHISIPKSLLRAVAGMAAVMLASVAGAQASFPDKPIRIVVPFSPGGGADLIARTVSAELAKELGQPVIVDNKPGAGTVIGSDLVAKSTPDGYTLLLSSIAHSVNPSLADKLPYATEKDFAPVAMLVRSPNVLVVRADSPYRSVKDIIEAAKAKPDVLTYASPGNGTSSHLAGALFEELGKIRLQHITYKGSAPALTDLLGGQTDILFGTSGSVGAFIESGKLRAVAVTSAVRSSAYPSVPTMIEAGVPGYITEGWYGLHAPARTPVAVIEKLNAAARKATTTDFFKSKLVHEGMVVQTGAPIEYENYVRAEIARWSRLVKTNVITK